MLGNNQPFSSAFYGLSDLLRLWANFPNEGAEVFEGKMACG